MFGSLIGGLLSAGKKPKIPEFKETDATEVQQKTIAGNIANFADASKLTSQVNFFNQAQLEDMLKRAIPEYQSIAGQASENIKAGLAGKIPEDVAAQIRRNTNASAVAGGIGGAGLGRNLTARDLGLTSLQITNNALAQAQEWLQVRKQLSVPTQADPSSMFLTPGQRLSLAASENQFKWQADSQRALIRAMPDPKKKAIGDWMTNTDSMLMSFGLGSMGGFTGGGMKPA